MLVSITQACKELGVSLNHMRAKIRSGEWPCYQLGTKAIRIDVDEIKQRARRETVTAPPDPAPRSRKKTRKADRPSKSKAA
jgi:excisionase family DNA binding protein